MKTKVIPAPEVAYILRRELGPIRAWDDTLADMRRGRVSVNGCTLKPICRSKHGRAWRPMYRAFEVVEFIRAVRAANPDAKRNAPPLVKTTVLDPADHRDWKTRKLATAVTVLIFGRPAPTASTGL